MSQTNKSSLIFNRGLIATLFKFVVCLGGRRGRGGLHYAANGKVLVFHKHSRMVVKTKVSERSKTISFYKMDNEQPLVFLTPLIVVRLRSRTRVRSPGKKSGFSSSGYLKSISYIY